MDETCIQLTVFFEEPFWVGLFERAEGDRLSVCRVVFGAEPKDYEVWDAILQRYEALSFGPAVGVDRKPLSDNPKRRQRSAGKQLQRVGIGTRAQQALQAQREAMKAERREIRREAREAAKAEIYQKKRQKKKEKRKGH